MEIADTPKEQGKLPELIAKALRRGEKLANTLRRLAAKGDLNDVAVSALLQELEQAFSRLRRRADQQNDRPAKGNALQVEMTFGTAGAETSSPPQSKSRKAKRQPDLAAAGAE